jgi:hypothetical protein
VRLRTETKGSQSMRRRPKTFISYAEIAKAKGVKERTVIQAVYRGILDPGSLASINGYIKLKKGRKRQ